MSRARRTPGRDDPWSACPWPAAPGRARWSGLESGENAFQCARSWGVLPGMVLISQAARISLFGGLVLCPAGCRQCSEGDGFALPRRRPRCKTCRCINTRSNRWRRRGPRKSRNSAENDAPCRAAARARSRGEVLFDPFNRGRYATDASFYQIMPAGVVVPRTIDEALRALAICRDDGRIVTPRGGGTSQCGQTVNDGIVIDFSKHLNRIISLDVANRTCVVEPGIVLDDLNRQLKTARPVVSGRCLHGLARHHRRHGRQQFLRRPLAALRHHARQHAVAWMPHWPTARCCISARCRAISQVDRSDSGRGLFRDMLALGAREAAEIAGRFPKVQRRVGGYNLDALVPRNARQQHGASAGRLGRHPRLHHADRTEAVAGDPQQGARRLPFRQLLRGDGCRPASGQADADRGRAGRSHHAGARPRDRDVPADHRRPPCAAIRMRC